MLKRIGALAVAWYLLLPNGGEFKPVANQSESLAGWRQLGAFDSALACELARLAKPERERSHAVCVLSDDPRLRR
ncbi:MAG TPA: hypothetical protein VID28_05420 [Methylomirabilota bacterium]|jgi:hypothetical protein